MFLKFRSCNQRKRLVPLLQISHKYRHLSLRISRSVDLFNPNKTQDFRTTFVFISSFPISQRPPLKWKISYDFLSAQLRQLRRWLETKTSIRQWCCGAALVLISPSPRSNWCNDRDAPQGSTSHCADNNTKHRFVVICPIHVRSVLSTLEIFRNDCSSSYKRVV